MDRRDGREDGCLPHRLHAHHGLPALRLADRQLLGYPATPVEGPSPDQQPKVKTELGQKATDRNSLRTPPSYPQASKAERRFIIATVPCDKAPLCLPSGFCFGHLHFPTQGFRLS